MPALLLGAQVLLESGLFPLDVPFRAGEFTSTIGNRGLVAELAVLSLGFSVALVALPGRGTRAAGLLFLAANLGAIVLADSRSGWLGAAAAGAVAGVVAWLARGAEGDRREGARPGRGPGLVAFGLLALVLGAFGAARLEIANPSRASRRWSTPTTPATGSASNSRRTPGRCGATTRSSAWARAASASSIPPIAARASGASPA
ncbi:MAG: hypothetical protein R3F20_12510 [Planctomycetota bacterium]